MRAVIRKVSVLLAGFGGLALIGALHAHEQSLGQEAVQVLLFEGGVERTWDQPPAPPDETFGLEAMALCELPQKYGAGGLRLDRKAPVRVRLVARPRFAEGTWHLVLRARSAARIWVDGKLLGETRYLNPNASGHEAVPPLIDKPQGLFACPPGHQQKQLRVDLGAGEHVVVVEAFAGGRNLRTELGTLMVAISPDGQQWFLLPGAGEPRHRADQLAWESFLEAQRRWLRRYNQRQRRVVSQQERQWWERRHEAARRFVAAQEPIPVPALPAGYPANNAIDHFLGARMAAAGVQPAELTDDYQFLRRLCLDVLGAGPTAEMVRQFVADPAPQKRQRWIDRLLQDDRWADHWVSYWQDVLAENPGILKPKQNNTGPFRWWIYESMLDNKPMDWFVTDLVMMEGSVYGGGPAGFALATQNDVPMAAKAHVLAQAFLARQMQCARCHDAPYHPYRQEQLFQLAAMLQRKPIVLPATSSVRLDPGGRKPLVTVSLKPGTSVAPAWPFAEAGQAAPETLWVRRPGDVRAEAAARITAFTSERFAQVMVNRMWKRYMGWGLVEPVDSWEDAEASHPQLLRWLARWFVRHDYDWKALARLILSSHAYQRRTTPEATAYAPPQRRWFAAQARRPLTAEQLVDSLALMAGLPLAREPLTLDPEGRRPETTFLNLGVPRCSWMFTSLSNERDRPALAMPEAQSVVDVLMAFGWRDYRPNPVTVRPSESNIQQPLVLANGTLVHRMTRLSDEHRLTEVCLQAESTAQVVEEAFLHVLGRPPDQEELAYFSRWLAEGFDQRLTGKPPLPPQRLRHAVSWSNHLHPEATRVKMELEEQVRQGPPPTPRLQPQWRQRVEDMLWALVNSPEFVFVP